MAKTGKNQRKTKDQKFDELIQNNWYYNHVYIYLLKFESEFTNLSLVDFILNCNKATYNVLFALLNDSNNEDLTIKYIIDQNGYYETELESDYTSNYKLNDFELYLTKFIVAHSLIKYYHEDKKRTDYFNQIWSITQGKKSHFNYIVEYDSGNLVREKGVFYDWILDFNSSEYVQVKRKQLDELLSKLKVAKSNSDSKTIKIEPIKWQKKSVLLAYLINELKKYGFIDDINIWAICEQIFVDKKGNHIKAKTFTSMVKNYENNQTLDGTRGLPSEHNQLTELIRIMKAISSEIS